MGQDLIKLSYRDAGVDIDAGNQSVEEIKAAVRSTYRPEVIGDLGGFGGLFALNTSKYKNPVLVSGTDGVGTKLKIAFMCEKHGSIGQDVVAMCVNDILTQGAEPLFFLDYLAVGKLSPKQVKEIVEGIAAACRESGCALIGGETAEMAGFYAPGEYDIAGFAVGIVEREKILPSPSVQNGDVLLGLASSGLHSNGFSLVRKICFDHMKFKTDTYIDELGKPLGEELLTPTKLYVKSMLPLLEKITVKAMVHITGGGFLENIPRALPQNMSAEVNCANFVIPPIFKLLQKWGNVETPEMFRTFNMGLGMIVIVPPQDVDEAVASLKAAGETVFTIGTVTTGDHHVKLENLQ